MKEIKVLITDFDGTLVDTFEANFRAYSNVLKEHGVWLTRNIYKTRFGLRFDEFMDSLGIHDNDIKHQIRTRKAEIYPNFFEYITINNELLNMLRYSKSQGLKIVIASTAAKKNIMSVLNTFNISDIFDYIITGEDVKNGKPDPEVYNNALDKLQILPEEAIVFEDSEVGCSAASAAGIQYIKVKI